jgi:hypothetical protein
MLNPQAAQMGGLILFLNKSLGTKYELTSSLTT